MTPLSNASQLKSRPGQCLLLHVYDCEWVHCCVLMYTCVFACTSLCVYSESFCWYTGAFQIQLLILLPIRSHIGGPLCYCRQCRETIASYLCNLQTSSISAEMHGSLTCPTVSLGSSVAPQMWAQTAFFTSQHSFVFIARLPKPPCDLDGLTQLPFVLPVWTALMFGFCRSSLSLCFRFAWYEMFANKVTGRLACLQSSMLTVDGKEIQRHKKTFF